MSRGLTTSDIADASCSHANTPCHQSVHTSTCSPVSEISYSKMTSRRHKGEPGPLMWGAMLSAAPFGSAEPDRRQGWPHTWSVKTGSVAAGRDRLRSSSAVYRSHCASQASRARVGPASHPTCQHFGHGCSGLGQTDCNANSASLAVTGSQAQAWLCGSHRATQASSARAGSGCHPACSTRLEPSEQSCHSGSVLLLELEPSLLVMTRCAALRVFRGATGGLVRACRSGHLPHPPTPMWDVKK